jgi:diguanylate cyclase (GGDEF)-like protein
MSEPKPKTKFGGADANLTIQFEREDLGKGLRGDELHYVLVCIQGLEVGKPFELVLTETFVGRAPGCGLVLPDSQVSRRHAVIRWMSGYHTVEDLKSANGTFIGGARVTQRRLSPGDVIQFGSGFAYRYTTMDATEQKLMEQLYEQSVLDPLTKAHNREYFGTVFSNELERIRKLEGCTTLLLLDIDHFKRINDEHGHPAGDAVLIEFVERIRAELGLSDVLCRYGGEEFAVIVRGGELTEAARLAERIRLAIGTRPFDIGSSSINVTVSIGCASTTCSKQDDVTPETIIALADRRLYVAKETGRNRVVATEPEVLSPVQRDQS